MLKSERWRIDECPLLLPWSLWDKISTAALYVHYSFHWSAKGSAIGNFTMMPSVLSTAPCWISLPWRDDPLLLEISKGWRRCLSLQQIPELCSFPSPLAKSSAFPTTSLALSPHKDYQQSWFPKQVMQFILTLMQPERKGKEKAKACHTALSLGCMPWEGSSVLYRNTSFSGVVLDL